MRTRFSMLLMALVALGAPALAHTAGPAVGARVPALQVTTAAGAPASLASVAGRSGTVLVFVRSAKWCPYCQKQLVDLNAAVAPLAQRGYRMAAISYDDPAVLAGFASARGVGYPLLSDAGSRTIDAFGLRDPAYAAGHFAAGVPRPTILILAPDGTVRARLAEDDYRKRPPVDAVVAAVDGLGGAPVAAR